jgi:Fe2+ or Zn2+ uptake regulation protein
LIDVDDGRIEEISNKELVSQLSRVAEELGFKLVRFRLVLYGKLRSRERKAAGKGEGPVRRRLNGGGSSPAP